MSRNSCQLGIYSWNDTSLKSSPQPPMWWPCCDSGSGADRPIGHGGVTVRYTLTHELNSKCVICVQCVSRVLCGVDVSVSLFQFRGSPSTIEDAWLNLNFR